MADLYKQDGVDIDAGDAFSRYCAELARETFNNSPYVRVCDLSKGNFRGPRGYVLQELPNGSIQMTILGLLACLPN